KTKIPQNGPEIVRCYATKFFADFRNYYSKVSLYGKNKPLDIYREILFNTEEINEGKKTKTIYEKTLNILSKSPYIQGFIGNILIEHSISKINHSIVVLDDFERISTDN